MARVDVKRRASVDVERRTSADVKRERSAFWRAAGAVGAQDCEHRPSAGAEGGSGGGVGAKPLRNQRSAKCAGTLNIHTIALNIHTRLRASTFSSCGRRKWWWDVDITGVLVLTTQLADGDICRGLEIPIYMMPPRLFSCPSVKTSSFAVDFELNLVVAFDTEFIGRLYPIYEPKKCSLIHL
eukprot:1194919-Prorocentrum_minimum.AAC.4